MSRPPKPLTVNDERHGSNAGYAAGCRETCCVEARKAYQRKLRREHKEAYGKPGDLAVATWKAANAEARRARRGEPDLARMRLHQADDFGQGFLRRCSCGHTPGEHSVPKLGQPQPCDVKYCRCKDLDKPEVPEIRFHEGIKGPLRRLA